VFTLLIARPGWRENSVPVARRQARERARRSLAADAAAGSGNR